MWPKNFSSIHFFRFCSHEKLVAWSIALVSSNTPKYASNTIVKIPNAKLISLTQYKVEVFLWPFDEQEELAESRLHLFAATHASNISAKTLRKRYSTKVKIPIDKRTAASWKLRPCREAEMRYVSMMALNLPRLLRLWKISETMKKTILKLPQKKNLKAYKFSPINGSECSTRWQRESTIAAVQYPTALSLDIRTDLTSFCTRRPRREESPTTWRRWSNGCNGISKHLDTSPRTWNCPIWDSWGSSSTWWWTQVKSNYWQQSVRWASGKFCCSAGSSCTKRK
jgi:hypothetical protein